MARMTLDEIQGRIAAIVDQDEDTTSISSDDYSLRRNYINQSLQQWAEVYDWQVLYKEWNGIVSTSTGNASIVMPSDFRKLASYPKITYDGTQTSDFPEVRPQEDSQYGDTDKRISVLGNNSDGFILVVKGCDLSSGASVKVPYYCAAGSLASPVNITMCPNGDYLVQRSVAMIWEAREDARFPQAKVEAEKILRNMVEYENVFSEAATHSRVKVWEESHDDFRWGRD